MAARFRPGSEYGETVVLASYPRSGNSLLRASIERLSGVITGSDTVPTRTLSRALQDCGVLGEGIVDERVHVVKTHFPERRGSEPFGAQRAILLVRNPFDVIDSYFNMTLTNTHNVTMHDSQYARFSELFAALARAEVRVWVAFNKWWMRCPLPLLVVRYEDLVRHRNRTLRRVAWFLNGCRSIQGTALDRAVDEACAGDLGEAGPYRPRSGVVGSALRRFDDDLRSDIESYARIMLRNFGYDPVLQGFPHNVSIAPKALRTPVPPADDDTYRTDERDGAVTLVVNVGPEIREGLSPFGRYMTTLRKSLVDPVLSDAGLPLNVREVDVARDRAAAARAAHLAGAPPPPEAPIDHLDKLIDRCRRRECLVGRRSHPQEYGA